MTSVEFYQSLRQTLDKRLNADKTLSKIAEKIKLGKADFNDTAKYSKILADYLSQIIKENLGGYRGTPSGWESVCKELLKDHYTAVNDVLGEVQVSVDEKKKFTSNHNKLNFHKNVLKK